MQTNLNKFKQYEWRFTGYTYFLRGFLWNLIQMQRARKSFADLQIPESVHRSITEVHTIRKYNNRNHVSCKNRRALSLLN